MNQYQTVTTFIGITLLFPFILIFLMLLIFVVYLFYPEIKAGAIKMDEIFSNLEKS